MIHKQIPINEIKYHLEKAVYLATHGRRGPVWIDIPLDVQGSQVDEASLVPFDPELEGLIEDYYIEKTQISDIYKMLNESNRPAILIGHGVIAAGKNHIIHQLCNELKIPALATWRAKGVFGDDDELYMGSPGIPATRYSNYVLQNTDFLLFIYWQLTAAFQVTDSFTLRPPVLTQHPLKNYSYIRYLRCFLKRALLQKK